jgi:stage V sporulation protein D (sporulation-specific penicillin-binding protein)
VVSKKYRDKVTIKHRMIAVFCILVFLLCSLSTRIGYLMIVKSKEYTPGAIQQWTSDVKIDAKRGKILDRNGHELAISANVYRVDLDLNTLRDEIKKNSMEMKDISLKLAEILEMEEKVVFEKLTKPLPNGKPRGAAILRRRIEKEEVDEIRTFCKEKKISGIVISPDTKRFYPNNNFLSHVMGHTNSDGKGLMGVELVYDKFLSGIPGIKISELDAIGEDMPYVISDYTKPVDGKNVLLTIDETIQYFAEKAAEQALIDNNAKAVTVVVMDPNNGEILALVNKPDYNPNDPWVEDKSYLELQHMWRNRAVSDTFEPGSIFKVVTATAALAESKVKEDDTFYCKGSTKVANRTIRCHKRTGHGQQIFEDILKNSCNMGFIELGKRLQAELLNKYVQLFGFGKKTGIDLNGEAAGIIKKTKDITEIDLATISFGQTNTVSIIQYLQAFNAIANGGKLIIPHVMKQITHYDENNNMVIDKEYSNYNERQIVDEKTLKELRGYLEKVVSEGGGKNAYIPGYHIGGKTGTAQKIDLVRGGYAQGKYISSFAGMAPADKPLITVMVSIDEPDPSKYYASLIAAPVAKQVFNDVFNYLSFQPDATGEEIARSLLKDVVIPEIRGMDKAEAIKILKEMHLKYEIEADGQYVSDISPKPGYSVKEGSKIIVYTSHSQKSDNTVVVPDLRGYNKENAEKLLSSLGLKVSFTGEGMVCHQSISAGNKVPKGIEITLQLDIIGD